MERQRNIRGMIEIDGSLGEGGGQLLRSALALAAWRRIPFRITHIRARRREPGLKAQHLTAVEAVARVCGAVTEGAIKGADTLTFRPGPVEAGGYGWSVGTAGATTLVAQAALPPLWSAAGDSHLRIEGGTHVSWSPPADYLRGVFARTVRRLGLALDVRLLRHGFYPRGGGILEVRVGGTASRGAGPHGAGASLPGAGSRLRWERPPQRRIAISITAVVSSLPRSIAERMLLLAARRLADKGWKAEERLIEVRESTGTYLFIAIFPELPPEGEAQGAEWIAGGFTGLGAPGKPAEAVAEEAVEEALAFLESDAGVDPRLADQLLLPALVAGVALEFRTNRMSGHLRSNAETVNRFLGPCVRLEEPGAVEIHPARSWPGLFAPSRDERHE